MSNAIPLVDYRANLRSISDWVDPTLTTPEMERITSAARSLSHLPAFNAATLTAWAQASPREAYVLGLVVGLGQEKLKNRLREAFGTSGWVTLARDKPQDLIAWFIATFELDRLLTEQLGRTYSFGDVLVARAGTRVTAAQAGKSGRKLEDLIEEIAVDLSLPYATRGRFIGRNLLTAPFDLAIPGGGADAKIVVAAKGFDSTGSKLGDAVREIMEMAEVRRPDQYVIAVVDGIGWMSRDSDLARIHDLWAKARIDGMYTVTTLGTFHDDLRDAAVRSRLLP